jgi:hypothetical protein
MRSAICTSTLEPAVRVFASSVRCRGGAPDVEAASVKDVVVVDVVVVIIAAASSEFVGTEELTAAFGER